MINKQELLEQIVSQLEHLYQNAIDAAERAHQSATDKENIAENKYDTLGLEAAYLAAGQSRRVVECEEELRSFQQLLESSQKHSMPFDEIKVGSFVQLEDEDGAVKYLFIGSTAGGLKLNYLGHEIMIITPFAPLGKALMGLGVDDEISLTVAGEKKEYFIAECL